MLQNTFEYVKPNSLGEVLRVLDELRGKKAHVLAGGTDLIPRLRDRSKQAEYVIDLAGAGLNQLVFEKDQVRIGALVTFATLCQHPEVRKKVPAIAQAAVKVGAVQTRTLATIGGNLCEGVPSNDSAPALLVLDAKFRLQAKGAERLVAAEQFFVGPRRTLLVPGEILTEIIVPLQNDFKATFLRFGRRRAMSLSVVSAAAGVAVRDNREIATARIALGAVAPIPLRAHQAEQVLSGRKITPEALAEAADVAATEISPISDMRGSAEFRRSISAVLVRRALENALRQATGPANEEEHPSHG
ncbi:MAG: xanthine dehydrogenase family protein subunit M [Terriglobales bacterium]